ncbi:MAG: hypothetical protein ACFFEE_07980 [Candidatus Thorarchaeota archaeon]
MGITVDPEDILSIEIKYREKEETTDGYAVVQLREHIPNVSVFHFMFSMSHDDFLKQVSELSASSKQAGYELNLIKKSSFVLSLEKMMVGALAGTEYQSHGCPSCRMIDAFVSSSNYMS